jgi:hypothetical protein
MSAARIVVLEQRVKDFQRALEGFQGMRTRLLERRQNATDSAMLRIDEMLTLNARTVKSLEGALATSQRELRLELEQIASLSRNRARASARDDRNSSSSR